MSLSRQSQVRCKSSSSKLCRSQTEYNLRQNESSRKNQVPFNCYSQECNSSVQSVSEDLDDSEGEFVCDEEEFENQTADLQLQEIWRSEEIQKSLHNLAGAQVIVQLVKEQNYLQILNHEHSNTTGVLISSWLGNDTLLEMILHKNYLTDVKDLFGRTPLHLAACAGSRECVTLLLSFGALPNVWDTEEAVTPLHCAASVGSLPCLKLLIDAGATVDAGLSTLGLGKTPLHFAVQSNAISCVNELLKHGANLNMTQVYTETPLHVAACMGFSTCLKILLDHGADVRVQYGSKKSTPLHLAAEDGNSKCAELLLSAGADINAVNSRMQTPTHLAALAQCTKTLELLLSQKANPNAQDIDLRTPLHCAIVKGSRSSECVSLLVQYGAKVNAADIFGYTPVHIAALNEYSNCLKILIDHGADMTMKTKGNVSALSFITRRTPDVLQYFEKKMNHSIKLHDHEIGDVDCEIQLDFRILIPNVSCGETCLLLTFIEAGHRRILKHPLSQIFLFLKWRRIRKYFLLSLALHAFFVILCSYYQVGVFLHDCPTPTNCVVPLHQKIIACILFFSNLLTLSKEIFQIAHSRFGYIYQWENWLQWIIIISVFICLIPPSYLGSSLFAKQQNISVFGIFFNWVEMMILIGRFPMFGLYIQMFTRGSINFAKFFLAYFFLLAAFTFSFRMLFPQYKSFRSVIMSFSKVVMMMTGELEFEDVFFTEEPFYPLTTLLFFLLFTLLVTTVLTNLLVGLSVSDIQGLQKSAGLDRSVRTAELVAYMESMLFSRLLHWIPRKILTVCHKSALLLSSSRQWTLIIRPNDPREKKIPKELIRSAYKCLSEQKSAQRGRYSGHNKHEKPIKHSYV